MAEKAVRKTTEKRTPRKTAAKKVAARTVAARKDVPVSARKAPSRAITAAAPRTRLIAPVAAISAVCAVFGISALIGYSDTGHIDVEATIADRKQNATPEEQERFKTVPVQQGQSGVVNGGLVGAGKHAVVTSPVTEAASSSDDAATSSDETASSTDEGVTADGTDHATPTEAAESTPSDAPAAQ